MKKKLTILHLTDTNAFKMDIEFCTLVLYLSNHYKDKVISKLRYSNGLVEFVCEGLKEEDFIHSRLFTENDSINPLVIDYQKIEGGYLIPDGHIEIITELSIEEVYRKLWGIFGEGTTKSWKLQIING